MLKPRGPRENTRSACGLDTRSGAVTPASLRTLTRNVRQPCSTSSATRLPCVDVDAALGIDVHVEQAVPIENLLDARRRGARRREAAIAASMARRSLLGQRRPEILQRLEQAGHLRRERLELDGDDGRRSSRLEGGENCREADDENGGQSVHGLDSTAGGGGRPCRKGPLDKLYFAIQSYLATERAGADDATAEGEVHPARL